ncbi:MAG: hypothetical protein JXQ87_18345 [Bacteroidia bacterium]
MNEEWRYCAIYISVLERLLFNHFEAGASKGRRISIVILIRQLAERISFM